MIFYINLNIWKFYYKNNWNFLSFKQLLIKQNFSFLYFSRQLTELETKRNRRKIQKGRKLSEKARIHCNLAWNHETRDTSRHVSCEVWRKMWPWSFLRRQRRRWWKEREREKRKEEEKKHGPFSRQLLWKWTACVRKRTVTYPRGDARVNPCISPVTLLGMRLSKVAAKVRTKKKKGGGCLSFRRWLVLASEEALSCHESPLSFRLTNPLKLATRERSMLGQSTNRYL